MKKILISVTLAVVLVVVLIGTTVFAARPEKAPMSPTMMQTGGDVIIKEQGSTTIPFLTDSIVHVSLTVYGTWMSTDDSVEVKIGSASEDGSSKLTGSIVLLEDMAGMITIEFDAAPSSNFTWAIYTYMKDARTEFPMTVGYTYTMTCPAQE